MSWVQDTATDFADLLVRHTAFLTEHGHSLPPIFTGIGTGTVSQVLGTATTVQETISVAFTSATEFTVAGSVTGSMGTGTVGTAFTHAKISFLVSSGATAWASGDTISWVMTPAWTKCRLAGGCAHLASASLDITKITDGSASTYTNPLATTLPQYGGLHLLQAEEVRSVLLRIYSTPGNGPRDYAAQYSDTGTDGSWTTAASWTAQTWSKANEIRIHDIPACGAHPFWRLLITAANGAYVDLADLSFHRATGGGSLDLIPWFGDAVWCAPGNAGTDQIYMGAKLWWNPVGAYWCWKLGGFTGFAPGTPFESLPGAYCHAYMSLWNASLPYWAIADGRTCKVIAKVTSQYEQAYLGFIDNYISPGNYPYPLFVGGSMGFANGSDLADTNSGYRYAAADETHRAYWSPGGDNYSGVWGQAALRKVGGTWKMVAGVSLQVETALLHLWPACNMRGLDYHAQDLRLNLDGSVALLPAILSDGDPNIYGELSGVMWLSGNNQSAENILTMGRIPWLVMQNVARVGIGDYAAYRLT